MKTYGTATLEEREIGSGTRRRARRVWVVRAEPYVLLRLKRLFDRLDKGQLGELLIIDSPEVCRELLWFTDRFPLTVTPLDCLQAGAAAHRDREEVVQRILAGEYKPPEFSMMEPPRDYQSVAAALALKSQGLLIGDEMGVGKSHSAAAMLTDPRTRPTALVVPTALPRQWRDLLVRLMPNIQVHIAKAGTPPDDIRAKHKGRLPDVVVLNYSKLAGWAEYLADWIKSVVFDEVQALRKGTDNDETDTEKYKAARYLARAAQFRLGLSGTPFMNYGEEMWPVMDVLSPGCLGTREEFLREWCHADGNHHLITEPRVFGQYLRDQGLMLRRTKADVKREMPPCQIIEHHIEADLKQIERVAMEVSELARVILAETERNRGDKRQASAELDWKLRQATGLAKAPYVAAFVRLLVESGEQVLLFGWHHAVYDVWREMLADLNPVFFYGQTSQSQKHRALEEFKAGRSKVLIMSLRSGEGIDGLQHCCSTVVFGEMDWSFGWHEQDIARAYRDGQLNPVTAYFLLADVGSDPVIASVLGIKSRQLEQVRDPKAPLVERVQLDPHHIRRLAEQWKRRAA